jgi:hypothetical protein
MSKEYVFINRNDEKLYSSSDIDNIMSEIYQISYFKNPNNDKYHIRKIIIKNNIIINYDEGYYDKKYKKNIIKKNKINNVLQYNTYNLHDIPFPNTNEILLAQSNLLK